jgi:hypothetical protein
MAWCLVKHRDNFTFTLHREELHDSCKSESDVRVVKSRGLQWAGHVVRVMKVRNAFTILTVKPLGPKKWEDNIKMDIRKIVVMVVGR